MARRRKFDVIYFSVKMSLIGKVTPLVVHCAVLPSGLEWACLCVEGRSW